MVSELFVEDFKSKFCIFMLTGIHHYIKMEDLPLLFSRESCYLLVILVVILTSRDA